MVKGIYIGPEIYQVRYSALIKIAEQLGRQDVSVKCELKGVEYYQQQGFRPVGSVFMDAGIPRQSMECRLTTFSLSRVELTH
jgi:predicted GNAT family N-acyltransferase